MESPAVGSGGAGLGSGSGPGGGGGGGGGGKGNGKGTSPSAWHFKVCGKGKGKKMEVQTVGSLSEVNHILSLPNPQAIAISSLVVIDDEGFIEEADASMQVEFSHGGGAAATMTLATEGATAAPTWLDEVKVNVITWSG